jgi:hypothetical protein
MKKLGFEVAILQTKIIRKLLRFNTQKLLIYLKMSYLCGLFQLAAVLSKKFPAPLQLPPPL